MDLIGPFKTKIFAAQATGCSPVTTAIKKGTDVITPVKPTTIAKSIAMTIASLLLLGLLLARSFHWIRNRGNAS